VTRRRAAAAVGLVLAVLLLGACTTVRGLIDTEEALTDAGYTDVEMGFNSAEGFNQIEVTLRPGSTLGGADAAEEVAEVVWKTFPLGFDVLVIVLRGSLDFYAGAYRYTYSEMAELFGPRPAGFDDKELSDDVVRAGLGVVIVLAVGGLLFTAAVVLAIVFGVRASRRRKSLTPPPWPPVPRSYPGG